MAEGHLDRSEVDFQAVPLVPQVQVKKAKGEYFKQHSKAVQKEIPVTHLFCEQDGRHDGACRYGMEYQHPGTSLGAVKTFKRVACLHLLDPFDER